MMMILWFTVIKKKGKHPKASHKKAEIWSENILVVFFYICDNPSLPPSECLFDLFWREVKKDENANLT